MNTVLLCFIVVLLPNHHKFIAPLIGLWIVNGLIKIVVEKPKFSSNQSLITLMIFYVLLGVGVFWSDNQNSALFDLEVKMSLIIFPLLLSFIQISLDDIKLILKAFYLGLIASSIILFYLAFLDYTETSSFDEFFYVRISENIHPSYLSYYLVIGILMLCIDLYSKTLRLFKYNWVYVLLILGLFLFNNFILSKIGVITALFLIIGFTFFYGIKNKKYLQILIVLMILVVIAYLAYTYSFFVKKRADELLIEMMSNEEGFSNRSTGIRVKIWGQGILLFAESPFVGYGTGDVKDILMLKYQENDMIIAHTKELNAHNQFLQIALAIGGLGLAVYIASLISAVRCGIKNHNGLITCFVIISIIFMSTESVLENQAGTIFFGLFFSLLNQKELYKQ